MQSIASISYGQNTNFKNLLKSIKEGKNHDIELALNEIDTTKISDYEMATWLFYKADIEYKKDNHHLAYRYINNSKNIFQSLEKQNNIADCNFMLLEILSHQNKLLIDTDKIIKELEYYAIGQNDSSAIRKLYNKIASKYLSLDNAKKAILYFRKTIPIALAQKDTIRIGHAYTNIGTVQYSILKNPDSALFYYKKAVPFLKKFDDYQSLAYNYNNQAIQYKILNDYTKAISFYKKADSIPLNWNVSKTKIVFYKNIAEVYLLNRDYKNASCYLDKLNKLKDSINDTKQNIAISEIKEQYDNEKLRADNLEIESKRKQNKNLLIGALAFILFGGITAFLIQKNTRKKQKLAEQEKALETQKLATVLKEQELKSIDAMIEGQEKERQRIANDLHDDLGGLMATVKLHFNVLKDKQTPELFDKTTNLLDEAYNKIRGIAHAKNSGVIAKQGLLKAVQNMADKISVSNKITVDVIDHGLENRLENSLELTIFRIIQELITNVIKHADASETTIHLTNHDDTLNIMIEDNGVGFSPNQVTTKNKGMGISSIDKRIEHLNGKMTIESEHNKGTTIIIDIPT